MLLKSMGLPYVIARATDTQHAEILHRVGADKVVFPEEEAAERAASLDLSPNYVEFMNITEDTGVHKIRPPERMRGLTLRDAGLSSDLHRSRVAVMVLRRGREYILNPPDDEIIDDGDVLVVVGSHEDVERAFAR
jgi:trk system potassium uptake protein TrkA